MYRLKNRLAAAGAVLLAAMAFYLPAAAKDALVKEGVYVDGVALGGLDKWDAQWAVEDHVDELAASEAVLTFGDHTQQVPLSTFGLEWANQGIIDEIMSLGTGGNVISRYKDQKDIEHDSRNYSLEFSSSEKKIRTYVEGLKEYNSEPVDAVIYTTDELTPGVEGGTDGISIDVEGSVQAITEAVNSWDGVSQISLELPVKREKPDVPYEDLAIICDVLGTATTDYSASSWGRAINVENGCRLISGTLLYPGDYFSVTDAVTPFTPENGYEQAPSYEENRVVDSYGGGICQVSTTLYNAVLKAELEVTARSNHTMVVTYVDLSKDAAIAEGNMDMSFVNNKENPIYIIGYTYGGQITFTIFGHETRPANRTLEFVSYTTSEIAPSSAKLFANGSQPIGYINQTQSPHTGYTAELWKNVYYDGVLSDSIQINSSYYTAVGTIYDVGVLTDNQALASAMYAAIGANDLSQVQAVIANQAAYTQPQSETPAAAAGTNGDRVPVTDNGSGDTDEYTNWG